MALVAFRNLVIDVEDPGAAAQRWGRWLGLHVRETGQGAVLSGQTPQQTIRLHAAAPKTVKNRVHLDLVSRDPSLFEGLETVPSSASQSWTTYLDPEGHEFCVFAESDRPDGLKDVVVDAVDHRAIARWWADVFGATLGSDDYSWVDDIPGAPTESFDFVDVPEPKTVKNRVHWDVVLLGDTKVEDLVERGATVLAPSGADRDWTVMADPEGNEFCVFTH